MKIAVSYLLFCMILGAFLPLWVAGILASCVMGVAIWRVTAPLPDEKPNTIARVTHKEH